MRFQFRDSQQRLSLRRSYQSVPPKYADGCFDVFNPNTGLLRYRYYLDCKRNVVYGHSQRDCWQKRYERNMPNAKKEKTQTELTYKKWSVIWLKEKKPYCKSPYYNSIEMYLKPLAIRPYKALYEP